MKLLIIVDFQNDFVTGSLGFPEAKILEEVIYQKALLYKNDGDDVLLTLDTHSPDYLNTQEGKKLPIIHCIKNTDGWNIFGKVNELEGLRLEKKTFGSVELVEYLKDKDYEEIELVGLVSNICVLSNAIIAKATLPEAKIIVDAKATASSDSILHEKALDVLEGLQIEVRNRG